MSLQKERLNLYGSSCKNSDGDSEIQDPLKEAVKQILQNADLRQKLNEVAEEVSKKLQDVAEKTLGKLKELNTDIASSLNPLIPAVDSLKWFDVFKKISISGDNDIPINKRGSGVKRLVLLSFFMAEVEKRSDEANLPSVIYAVEEPEASQHSSHQINLINAFLKLAGIPDTQIIITTHSPMIVKKLKFEHLRLISTDNEGVKIIKKVLPNSLPYPSLNEVNYLAFSEVTEEYHNELYGFLEDKKLFDTYKSGKLTRSYKRVINNGTIKDESKILTEVIRHQIHHPENQKNERHTHEELKYSIELMRDFIYAQQ